MNRSNIFILLCIPCRLLIAYLANVVSDKYLKIMGYIYGLVGIGFMYAYLNKMQNTPGIKGNIWWHDLRPIFSVIYAGFSILAIACNRSAYKLLYIDVIFGLLAFLVLKENK